MNPILLSFFFLSLAFYSYGQTLDKGQSTCRCTVERLSGDRESGSLKVTVTAQPLNQNRLTLNGDTFLLSDEQDFALYQELTFERELAYPYLYLTYQQQTYTLDMEAGRLYAGPIIIGKAENATEAFEVLITQVLLPQECQQAHITFRSPQNAGEKIYLLPGSFYN